MRRAGRSDDNWETPQGGGADPFQWEHVSIEVLMYIREQLRTLNRLLHCPNFTAIPMKLDKIHRKIPTRRKAKK